MLVVVYLNGMHDGLAKEVKEFKEACEFIDSMGEERINKVIITDLYPTKVVTKEDLTAFKKW